MNEDPSPALSVAFKTLVWSIRKGEVEVVVTQRNWTRFLAFKSLQPG